MILTVFIEVAKKSIFQQLKYLDSGSYKLCIIPQISGHARIGLHQSVDYYARRAVFWRPGTDT